jgi:hypothetical protein
MQQGMDIRSEVFMAVTVGTVIFWFVAHVDTDLLEENAASNTFLRNKYFRSGLMGFWILAIVQYSKEHNISETESVSFLR